MKGEIDILSTEQKWNERYQTRDYAYGKEPNDFLRQISPDLPPGKILCLAEGEGRNAVFLAGLGHEVVAVDSSNVGMKKAQTLAREYGVTITTETMDLAEFEIEPESWDAVISIFCHVPVGLREKLHQKVVAGLRPGGLFVLEAYTPKQLEMGTGGPPDRDLLMTLPELKRELAGLGFEHALETERRVVEGRLHFGTGAVVQIVARKPVSAG